jgi:hypothetical protein
MKAVMRNTFRPLVVKRKIWFLFRLLMKTGFPDMHKNIMEKHEFKFIFKIINGTRSLIRIIGNSF